jgi:hypothetical protein
MGRLKDHMMDIEEFCQKTMDEGTTFPEYMKAVQEEYPNDYMSQEYAESIWHDFWKNYY